jgi:hypothetical protein
MAGWVDWFRKSMGWVSSAPSSVVTEEWVGIDKATGRTPKATATHRVGTATAIGRVSKATAYQRPQ